MSLNGCLTLSVLRGHRDGLARSPSARPFRVQRVLQDHHRGGLVHHRATLLSLPTPLAQHRLRGDRAEPLVAQAYADPVRLCDERLSTVSAEAVLREQGRKGKRRRAVVDQAAAVVILQNALDTERGTGRPAGEPVTSADQGEP